MTKKLLASIITGAFAAGAGSAQLAHALTTPGGNTLTLVNAQFVRGDLDDGGVLWNVRTCGSERAPDGGVVAEPCWQSVVSGTDFAPLAASLLSQKP